MGQPARKLNVEHKQQFSNAELEQYLFGKKQPQALDLEEVVLGAIMIDKEAYSKVGQILEVKHFYDETHQSIFKAMEHLTKDRAPIDMLTVRDKLSKDKKFLKKDPTGGAIKLMELTSKVASSANIEYHARIIHQKYLYRDAITVAQNLLKKAYEESEDIFEMRNKYADELTVMPPQSFFHVSTFQEDIKEGLQAPELKKLCGTIWNRTEVAFFFAPPGTGKTIGAIQIANAISKGEDVIPGILENECEPMKVLYIDFELTNRNIADRYTNKDLGRSHDFNNENLKRVSINPDFLDFEKRLDKIAQTQIERLILVEKPEAIIVDNITFLTNEGTHDTEVAVRIMKKLSFYKRKYDLSLLVLAHTTKSSVSKFLPLTEAMMAGSGQLQNFADAIFGLKASAYDSNLVYLKQFKDRSEQKIFTEENVLVMEIEKGGADYNFLQFRHHSLSRESAHIEIPGDDDNDIFEIQMEEAARLLAEKKVTGIRPLAKEINWKQSKSSLNSKLKKFVEGSDKFKYNEKGKVVFAEDGPF